MKLRVFDKESDKEVYLKLVESGNDVWLSAVDKQGQVLSNLIHIKSDGVYFFTKVDPSLGFELNSHGELERN